MYSPRASNLLPSKALVPFEVTSLGDSSCTVITASRPGIDVVVLSKEVAMNTAHGDCDCIVVSIVVAITRANTFLNIASPTNHADQPHRPELEYEEAATTKVDD